MARGEEFRFLLLGLKRYFELLVCFDAIDTGDDRKINKKEFHAAAGLLAGWGVPVTDSEAVFRAIDLDRSGTIQFPEFAGWALKAGLDVDPSDTTEDERAVAALHRTTAEVDAEAAEAAARKKAERKARKEAAMQNRNDLTRGIDLRKIAASMHEASGAETKAVSTEAGMFALRERRVHVTQDDFEMAVAKVMQKDSEKNMSLKKLWK